MGACFSKLKLFGTISKLCGESCCRGQEHFICIVGESGACGKVAETHKLFYLFQINMLVEITNLS